MRSLTFLENIELGKEYFLHYKDVYNIPFLSAEEISELQFNKIKQLIHLAYDQTDFYRNLYSKHDIFPEDIKTWKDFNKLPIVTKEDLNRNPSGCIVNSRKGDKSLIVSRSSGSSGQVINIMFENTSWYQQALITLRMYQSSFNYKPYDKLALIYPSKFPYNSILGLFKAQYIYSLNDSKDIIKELFKINPQIITCYPSILFELIVQSGNELQALKPKAITTNSEQSTQEQRDYISSFFNCPVYDEYSTEELALVGFQCKYKNYHVQEDSSYIEIVDSHGNKTLKDGQVGEVVGTCLVNNVMPFIRYRQGDLGVIQKSRCSCNNMGRIISNISGRKNASFRLANGVVIPSGRILDWTYKLVLEYKIPILQFQVIQNSLNDIEVIVVPNDGYNKSIHNEIIESSFKKEFGAFLSIKTSLVLSIPRTPAGKHIPIKSMVHDENEWRYVNYSAQVV